MNSGVSGDDSNGYEIEEHVQDGVEDDQKYEDDFDDYDSGDEEEHSKAVTHFPPLLSLT